MYLCHFILLCHFIKQNKMREHYNSSLDNVKFEMFPHDTKTVWKNVKETNI
jgi:predicted ABC-type ATPase